MKRNLWKILAAILVFSLMLSFSFVTVAADESDEAAEEETGAVEETTGEAETSEPDESSADSTTTAATTTAATTTASTTNASTTASSTSTQTKESHYGIVTLIIVAVILVIILIVFLRNREKGMKMMRSFKSEFKKIVWADRHDTLKNTILVVIAIVLFAAVFGIVDFALSQLILLLGRIL